MLVHLSSFSTLSPQPLRRSGKSSPAAERAVSWHMKQSRCLPFIFSPPFHHDLKKNQIFVALPINFQISHLLKLVSQPRHKCFFFFPILGLLLLYASYWNSSHTWLQMSLFSSSDLVPCWVWDIPDHKKQIPGVFWGDMASWLHNYLVCSRLSQSQGLLEFCQCFCSMS